MTQELINQKKEDIQKDIDSHKIMLYMKGNKDMPMCGFQIRWFTF